MTRSPTQYPKRRSFRLAAGRRSRSVRLAAAVAAIGLAHGTARADRYWIVNSGSWNTAANWSSVSGGVGGAGAPGATDNVWIYSNDALFRTITYNGTYTGNVVTGTTVTVTNVGGGTNVLSQDSGFNLACRNLYLGEDVGDGRYVQSGGSTTIDGFIRIADDGSSGSYSLSGGTLNLTGTGGGERALEIGENGAGGTGTFDHTGGTLTAAASVTMTLGERAQSHGIYTLNGASAVANLGGNAYVGGGIFAPNGQGQLNIQNGAMNVAGLLKVWNTTGTSVSLSGGSLSIGSLDTTANPSRFNWTGGALAIGGNNSTSTFDAVGSGSASLIKMGTGTLTITSASSYTGGTTISGGTVSIAANSALGNASGALNLNGGTLLATATLSMSRPITVNGGTLSSSGILNELTVSNLAAGSGSLTLGGGRVNISGSSARTGQTQVVSGSHRLLSAGGLGSGTVIINGGTLEQLNTSTNLPVTLTSGTFSAWQTVAANGTTTVSPGADVQLQSRIAFVGDKFAIGDAVNDLTGGGPGSSITVVGDGAERLPFANDYQGDWIIQRILEVPADAPLGNAANTVTLQVGGVLDTSATFATSHTVSCPAGQTSSFRPQCGTTLTINSALAGGGRGMIATVVLARQQRAGKRRLALVLPCSRIC